MSNLFAWLGGAIAALLAEYWTQVKGVVVSFWTICVFWVGFLYLVLRMLSDWIIKGMQALVSVLQNGVGSLSGDPCGGWLSGTLAISNTFFPLDECLRMGAAMIIGIWLPIGVYRLVKSWIPAGFAGGS